MEENVGGGQFSVVALENGKPEPEFLELLKEAEPEFGFNQMIALVIPSEASEL